MYGTTVSGIVSGLNKLNFTVKAVRVALEDLTPKLTFPAILQVKNDLGKNHFVVLHSIKRNSKFYVADPASGIRKMSSDELGEMLVAFGAIGAIVMLGFENRYYAWLLVEDKMLRVIVVIQSLVIILLAVALLLSRKTLIR